MVLSVTGVIWATGGFERASNPYLGAPTEPGTVIQTTFWDIKVDAATLKTGDKITIELTITNKRREGTSTLTDGIVQVRTSKDQYLLADYCLADRLEFSPLIPTPSTCTFLLDNDGTDADVTADVEVFVLDQQMSSGLLIDPSPEATDPVARIALVAEVVQ